MGCLEHTMYTQIWFEVQVSRCGRWRETCEPEETYPDPASEEFLPVSACSALALPCCQQLRVCRPLRNPRRRRFRPLQLA